MACPHGDRRGGSVSGYAGVIDVEQFGLVPRPVPDAWAEAEAAGLVHLYARSWAEEVELLQCLGLWPDPPRSPKYRYAAAAHA